MHRSAAPLPIHLPKGPRRERSERKEDYCRSVEISSCRQTDYRREKSGKHRRKGERQIPFHIESRQQCCPLVRLCQRHYAPQRSRKNRTKTEARNNRAPELDLNELE